MRVEPVRRSSPLQRLAAFMPAPMLWAASGRHRRPAVA